MNNTPKSLDTIADKQERQGAKLFFSALKQSYTEIAAQVERGQEPNPREEIIKNAVVAYHSRVQYEMAEWQYDDLTKRNPVKALQVGIHERILGKIKTWIALNTGKSIKSINATTLDHVQKMIVQGQAEGLGAKKIAQNIRTEAKGKFSAYRSLVISRTEGTRAASQGAKFGAEQWENITGQTKWKVWSAANQPGRTRDQHLEMIGTPPIPGDTDFIVGGYAMEGPGDPAGGKDNIINCRCRRYYMSERAAKQWIASNGGKPMPKVPTQQIPTQQIPTQPTPKKPSVPRKPRTTTSKPVPDAVDDELDEAIKIFDAHPDSKKVYENLNQAADREAYKGVLKEVERATVTNYTTSFYNTLNLFNRGLLTISEAPRKLFIKAHTTILNKTIDKFPDKHVGECYRAINIDAYGKEVTEYLEAFQNGTPHTEKAFMSTSYDKSRAFSGNVSFTVKSKSGAIIERLSAFPEKEVLFKAGQKFRVTGFTRQGNLVQIFMEEL